MSKIAGSFSLMVLAFEVGDFWLRLPFTENLTVPATPAGTTARQFYPTSFIGSNRLIKLVNLGFL